MSTITSEVTAGALKLVEGASERHVLVRQAKPFPSAHNLITISASPIDAPDVLWSSAYQLILDVPGV